MNTRLVSFSAAFIAIGFLTALSYGQDSAFDGGTSNPGVWNDPANWTGDVLPGIGNPLTDIGVDPAINPSGLSSATVNLSTDQSIGELRVGRGNNAVGVLNHSAGTLSTGAGGWSFIGVDGDNTNPTTGTYNLSGTAVFNNTTADGAVLIGGGGGAHTAGTENVGTVSVADTAQWTSGAMGVGWNDNNIGNFNQSAGSVSVNNWLNIGDSGGAMGTYEMTGGTLSFGEMSVGQNSGAVGHLNLSGSATVTGGNTRLGRDGAEGFLNVAGSLVDFTVEQLSLASNDGGFSNDSSGTLNFISDAGGVSVLNVLGDVTLNDALGGTNGIANLTVDLSGGDPGGDLLLIDVGGNLFGQFTGLSQGALVANSGGRFIDYTFGDGNNIALTTVSIIPEPSSIAILAIGLGIACCRRRR